MSLAFYSAAGLLIYAAALITLSLWSYRTQDARSYVIGSRRVGLLTTTSSTLAGQFNGGGVFLVFTWAMTVGYGSVWSTLGIALGYVVLALFARRIHHEAEVHDYINLPDLMAQHLGPGAAKFTSGIIIGKAVLFSTAQLMIAGKLVSLLFGVPPVTGVFGTAGFVAVYLWLGGYLTVVRTDLFQWMLLLGFVLAPLAVQPWPERGEVWMDLATTPSSELWGMVLFSAALTSSNADSWQRLFSARTASVGRASMLLVGPIFCLFIFAGTLNAKAFKLAIGADELSFFQLFTGQGLHPMALAALGVFTITAVMSTIDTQIFLFSSALSKTLLGIDLEADRERYLRVSRLSTVGLLAFLAVVASTVGSTLEFVFKAFSLAFILSPVAVYACLVEARPDRFRDRAAVLALSLGLVVYLVMFLFTSAFQNIVNTLVPVAITSVACWIAWLWGAQRGRLSDRRRA